MAAQIFPDATVSLQSSEINSMLGAFIGDIVGSRFEFHNHRNKDFDLFGQGCFVTDDRNIAIGDQVIVPVGPGNAE